MLDKNPKLFIKKKFSSDFFFVNQYKLNRSTNKASFFFSSDVHFLCFNFLVYFPTFVFGYITITDRIFITNMDIGQAFLEDTYPGLMNDELYQLHNMLGYGDAPISTISYDTTTKYVAQAHSLILTDSDRPDLDPITASTKLNFTHEITNSDPRSNEYVKGSRFTELNTWTNKDGTYLTNARLITYPKFQTHLPFVRIPTRVYSILAEYSTRFKTLFDTGQKLLLVPPGQQFSITKTKDNPVKRMNDAVAARSSLADAIRIAKDATILFTDPVNTTISIDDTRLMCEIPAEVRSFLIQSYRKSWNDAVGQYALTTKIVSPKSFTILLTYLDKPPVGDANIITIIPVAVHASVQKISFPDLVSAKEFIQISTSLYKLILEYGYQRMEMFDAGQQLMTGTLPEHGGSIFDNVTNQLTLFINLATHLIGFLNEIPEPERNVLETFIVDTVTWAKQLQMSIPRIDAAKPERQIMLDAHVADVKIEDAMRVQMEAKLLVTDQDDHKPLSVSWFGNNDLRIVKIPSALYTVLLPYVAVQHSMLINLQNFKKNSEFAIVANQKARAVVEMFRTGRKLKPNEYDILPQSVIKFFTCTLELLLIRSELLAAELQELINYKYKKTVTPERTANLARTTRAFETRTAEICQVLQLCQALPEYQRISLTEILTLLKLAICPLDFDFKTWITEMSNIPSLRDSASTLDMLFRQNVVLSTYGQSNDELNAKFTSYDPLCTQAEHNRLLKEGNVVALTTSKSFLERTGQFAVVNSAWIHSEQLYMVSLINQDSGPHNSERFYRRPATDQTTVPSAVTAPSSKESPLTVPVTVDTATPMETLTQSLPVPPDQIPTSRKKNPDQPPTPARAATNFAALNPSVPANTPSQNPTGMAIPITAVQTSAPLDLNTTLFTRDMPNRGSFIVYQSGNVANHIYFDIGIPGFINLPKKFVQEVFKIRDNGKSMIKLFLADRKSQALNFSNEVIRLVPTALKLLELENVGVEKLEERKLIHERLEEYRTYTILFEQACVAPDLHAPTLILPIASASPVLAALPTTAMSNNLAEETIAVARNNTPMDISLSPVVTFDEARAEYNRLNQHYLDNPDDQDLFKDDQIRRLLEQIEIMIPLLSGSQNADLLATLTDRKRLLEAGDVNIPVVIAPVPSAKKALVRRNMPTDVSPTDKFEMAYAEYNSIDTNYENADTNYRIFMIETGCIDDLLAQLAIMIPLLQMDGPVQLQYWDLLNGLLIRQLSLHNKDMRRPPVIPPQLAPVPDTPPDNLSLFFDAAPAASWDAMGYDADPLPKHIAPDTIAVDAPDNSLDTDVQLGPDTETFDQAYAEFKKINKQYDLITSDAERNLYIATYIKELHVQIDIMLSRLPALLAGPANLQYTAIKAELMAQQALLKQKLMRAPIIAAPLVDGRRIRAVPVPDAAPQVPNAPQVRPLMSFEMNLHADKKRLDRTILPEIIRCLPDMGNRFRSERVGVLDTRQAAQALERIETMSGVERTGPSVGGQKGETRGKYDTTSVPTLDTATQKFMSYYVGLDKFGMCSTASLYCTPDRPFAPNQRFPAFIVPVPPLVANDTAANRDIRTRIAAVINSPNRLWAYGTVFNKLKHRTKAPNFASLPYNRNSFEIMARTDNAEPVLLDAAKFLLMDYDAVRTDATSNDIIEDIGNLSKDDWFIVNEIRKGRDKAVAAAPLANQAITRRSVRVPIAVPVLPIPSTNIPAALGTPAPMARLLPASNQLVLPRNTPTPMLATASMLPATPNPAPPASIPANIPSASANPVPAMIPLHSATLPRPARFPVSPAVAAPRKQKMIEHDSDVFMQANDSPEWQRLEDFRSVPDADLSDLMVIPPAVAAPRKKRKMIEYDTGLFIEATDSEPDTVDSLDWERFEDVPSDPDANLPDSGVIPPAVPIAKSRQQYENFEPDPDASQETSISQGPSDSGDNPNDPTWLPPPKKKK